MGEAELVVAAVMVSATVAIVLIAVTVSVASLVEVLAVVAVIGCGRGVNGDGAAS